MNLPLEDEFNDVLSKAQKGLGVSTETLAKRAAARESSLRSARRGDYDEETVRAVAAQMGLNVEAVLALGRGDWKPAEMPEIAGFALVTTPFHEWTVNSFLVWDEELGRAIAFDTGTTADPMIEVLEQKGLELDALVVTHSHWDHFEGAPALRKRWPKAKLFLGRKDGKISVETQAIDEGFEYALGRLEVKGFDTPGHTVGGMSFTIGGLEKPIACVGDALFAASMGGANTSYDDALASMGRILALEPDTVLAPGHGPLSTVELERRMNCFAKR